MGTFHASNLPHLVFFIYKFYQDIVRLCSKPSSFIYLNSLGFPLFIYTNPYTSNRLLPTVVMQIATRVYGCIYVGR